MVDPSELKQLLRYEPETGKLYWLERASTSQHAATWNARFAGKEVFSISGQGYREGKIYGARYSAHRVIWAIVYGTWPDQVDHINGDRLDNRLINLREVLNAVLTWAVKREILAVNKAAGIEKLNSNTRRDRIWSEEECQRFISTAQPQMAASLQLALNTGQRQGDLLKLTWTAYDGSTLRLRQQKTGSSVRLRVSPSLKSLLDSLPRTAVTILTNSEGRPWGERAFQSAFYRAMKKAGIQGLTFHDLRGTYISRAHALGYSIKEIAESSGHSEKDAEQMIRKHYLAATDVVSIRRER